MNSAARSGQPRPWTDAVFARPVSRAGAGQPLLIGVLPGEGIGPEVVAGSLRVLAAAAVRYGFSTAIETGGVIGTQAESQGGPPLTDEVVAFCRGVFERGGCVLHGPGGGRFVYDLRRRFDLFCKLAPISPFDELTEEGPMRGAVVRGADILVVRENVGGLYQGEFVESTGLAGERRAELRAWYTETQVRQIIEVGTRLATGRRGQLMVVVKDGGVPSMSALWRRVAEDVARSADVDLSVVNVDYAAYRMLEAPRSIDVVVAPNMFGDVLVDLGGLVVGARGLTFSGNFSQVGAAVYQTSHGAAYDLVGTGRANPLGQILSVAMLLRNSFDRGDAADSIEGAVRQVLAAGYRTADLGGGHGRAVDTAEMIDRVVAAVASGEDPPAAGA